MSHAERGVWDDALEVISKSQALSLGDLSGSTKQGAEVFPTERTNGPWANLDPPRDPRAAELLLDTYTSQRITHVILGAILEYHLISRGGATGLYR